MSRSSTVTRRERPVAQVTSESGSFRVHAEQLIVETTERVQIIDLTERLTAMVQASPVREGIVHITSLHTTCTVFVNEFQSALLQDIRGFLETLVPREGAWVHNDPRHSDCDRANADAHLRALVLGHSLSLQVSGGEPVLGQWQRVLTAELDGPRQRTLRVSVMGI
jgi:secondary thiamine-phosphate synthase enzyme